MSPRPLSRRYAGLRRSSVWGRLAIGVSGTDRTMLGDISSQAYVEPHAMLDRRGDHRLPFT